MGFEEDSSGLTPVPAVREDHSHIHSWLSNPGSACCWLILYPDTASQRKRKLHQAGDLLMTLWTNSICGRVSLDHCFCQMGPQLPTGAVTSQAKVKGCPRSLKYMMSPSLSFLTTPCPITWSVTLQPPAPCPSSPSFLKPNLQQAEVRS